MNTTVFEAINITKKYRNTLALNQVSMSVMQGDIYGFIGENGAGKTTMIRLLTGLAEPTTGNIALFGKSDKKLAKQRERIGCIIESPSLYLDMTAHENLEVQRLQRGIPGKVCIDNALELVNLRDAGKKKAKDFSLGMRQRLALAIALLGNPEFLVLERICLLKCVDRQWMDHIDNMDQLRQGIALRGYGQKDPVVEYRIEGFDMFDQMVDSIRESSVKMLLTIELRAAGSAPKREQVAKPTGEGFVPGNGAPGVKGSPKGQPVRVVKIGRNDPCPCGSGLKFKKCTCAQYHPNGNNGGEE